jgi:hypothetical protein
MTINLTLEQLRWRKLTLFIKVKNVWTNLLR